MKLERQGETEYKTNYWEKNYLNTTLMNPNI